MRKMLRPLARLGRAAFTGWHWPPAERRRNMERMLRRVQRDVERVKLHTSLVLGPERALALLATGDRIFVDPRDEGCGINLLAEGKYEEDELLLFRRFLRPGSVVLDVGANYGYYSLNAALYVRPGGRVIGFEPNPHIHELFRSSIYANGFGDVVEARRLAVYDEAGSVPFLVIEAGPGGSHVVAPGSAAEVGQTVIEVPAVRLDDHLPPDMIVDLVKIDVEGREEHVLNGMRAVIARSPDILIFIEFFFSFFPDEAAFERFVQLVTDELGLRFNRILPLGRTMEVGSEALRGINGNLVLSRNELKPGPVLTILPAQLSTDLGGAVVDGVLTWRAGAVDASGAHTIAYGPYFYLPKGVYRLVLDGEFDGDFICRLQENFGDIVWEGRIGAGRGFSATIKLQFDAPRFEIRIVADRLHSDALRLRAAQFWLLR